MITVNCIGAGRWGPNLVRSFENLPGARAHIVCDVNEHALARIREHISGVVTTGDVRRAIEDPVADAVVVATPVRTHYDLARRGLEAGKHVFVEKPLCTSVEHCHRLIELAEKNGLILAVGHVFLFNAGIRKIRELIDSGELGRIHYMHATRTNLGPIRDDVNAAWDLASHDLSIFDYWLGRAPVAVSAHGQCFLGGVHEDVVVASYHYQNDVLACLHVSWLNPRKVREITLVGDRKMAVWNDMDLIEPVRVYDKSASPEPETPYADSFGAARAIIRDGDVVAPKVTGKEPLAAECAHFVDCIRTRSRPLNNARAATGIVETLTATDESIRQKGGQVLVHRGVAQRVLCTSTRPSPTVPAPPERPAGVVDEVQTTSVGA
ncbi:MAG: Gfo/Idh/MocA family protein [Phycisphaerae bacterium]